MTNFEAYNARKVDGQTVWLTFILVGWSYGSMGELGKQILYYLTLGGFGLWSLYRLFTLGDSIKHYNKSIAIKCGLTSEDISSLGLR